MNATKNRLSVKTVLDEIHLVTTELLEKLSAFNADQFNKPPSPDSWTAGQVAEHLVKSDSEMIKSLYGPTRSTSRNPGQSIEEIRNAFLDFGTKMSSPEPIIPAAKDYEKEPLIRTLQETRAQISEAILTLDLSATCTETLLGEATRWEIIHFVIYHTQRHTHQLKKIFESIGQ